MIENPPSNSALPCPTNYHLPKVYCLMPNTIISNIHLMTNQYKYTKMSSLLQHYSSMTKVVYRSSANIMNADLFSVRRHTRTFGQVHSTMSSYITTTTTSSTSITTTVLLLVVYVVNMHKYPNHVSSHLFLSPISLTNRPTNQMGLHRLRPWPRSLVSLPVNLNCRKQLIEHVPLF